MCTLLYVAEYYPHQSISIGALGYSLTGVIFLCKPTFYTLIFLALPKYVSSNVLTRPPVAPAGNCTVLERSALAWCPIAISTSGFLFCLRLRAIYDHDRVLVAAFFMLWLVILTGGILLPLSIKGGAVGSTMYCQDVWVSGLALSVI